MLSLLLIIFLIWLFFKLGVGIIKVLGFLIAAGLIFVFCAYLLIPFLALLAIGGLVRAVIR
ncbi:hypothetical protein [Lactobacillus kefiranofaciens]|uniref:Uncharacterized protein n=1 Tax=Lactobacillus kefiranofaciens TaxID=267818 RepID=A0AAX3UCM5_9LACO|nr:hypothetical protein [Lactobacillus kefiranofaciens]MCJ2173018.1 hypothetical protein [Lactobacillus kefiranofaciens]MDF4142898.1 hypothetical protein [Lactobacillus kefiranofaciens]PAK97840.1 hypothetical protein B8W86_07835 [Lactobacillus kefiranofaciens]QFQ67044.1 hypothetical protein LKK75_00250 [Lactobacillus kefiranofaciens subsp. kefiranofaciens]URW71135.1 hypothetical protein MU859_09425 [Lactobacillus kefiranofaciens subsp. kefirgranum]